MKLAGILGSGRGKLGNSVFRIRKGQQVVSQYQPVVSNPNTTGQQSQRAKFKLAVQVATPLASVGGFSLRGGQTMQNRLTAEVLRHVTQEFPLAPAVLQVGDISLNGVTAPLDFVFYYKLTQQEDGNLFLEAKGDVERIVGLRVAVVVPGNALGEVPLIYTVSEVNATPKSSIGVSLLRPLSSRSSIMCYVVAVDPEGGRTAYENMTQGADNTTLRLLFEQSLNRGDLLMSPTEHMSAHVEG